MDNNRIDKLIAEHQSEKKSLISILHDIQREEGFL
jgi:NADH:ubiquinone oxidoreductase subunit E